MKFIFGLVLTLSSAASFATPPPSVETRPHGGCAVETSGMTKGGCKVGNPINSPNTLGGKCDMCSWDTRGNSYYGHCVERLSNIENICYCTCDVMVPRTPINVEANTTVTQ